jgi:hypothetical protein
MLSLLVIGSLHIAALGPVQHTANPVLDFAVRSKRRTTRSRRAMPVATKPLAAKSVSPPVGADVSRFIQRRDICDHLRGEEPYDPERAEFLNKGMRENCDGTDKELRLLRKVYAKNPAILAKLAKYEDEIEEGPAED